MFPKYGIRYRRREEKKDFQLFFSLVFSNLIPAYDKADSTVRKIRHFAISKSVL